MWSLSLATLYCLNLLDCQLCGGGTNNLFPPAPLQVCLQCSGVQLSLSLSLSHTHSQRCTFLTTGGKGDEVLECVITGLLPPPLCSICLATQEKYWTCNVLWLAYEMVDTIVLYLQAHFWILECGRADFLWGAVCSTCVALCQYVVRMCYPSD